MEIVVDYDQCEANGVCVGIAPDMFRLDDKDDLYPHEGPVPADREEAVRDAIAQCPKAALSEKP
jgi:ferredoxin